MAFPGPHTARLSSIMTQICDRASLLDKKGSVLDTFPLLSNLPQMLEFASDNLRYLERY